MNNVTLRQHPNTSTSVQSLGARFHKVTTRNLRKPSTGVLALLLVFGWLVDQSLGVVHFAHTVHVVCAAHGDVVHGDSHSHEHPNPEQGAQVTDFHHENHAHDTCALLAVTPNPVLTPYVVSTPVVVPSLPDPADTTITVDTPAPMPTLALAPKTSPPC